MTELKVLTRYLRQGDVVKICAEADCTPRTYYQMLRAETLENMTSSQRRVFAVLLAYVKKRQAEATKITDILNQIKQL